MLYEKNTIKKILEKEGIKTTRVEGVNRELGGQNSNVYKITTSEDAYALKIYKSIPISEREMRVRSEVAYIHYLNKCGITYLEVKGYDKDEGWALFTWLNGKAIKQLNVEHIDEISRHIGATNNRIYEEDRNRLGYAKEACTDIAEFADITRRRIKEMLASEKLEDKAEEPFTKWLKNELGQIEEKSLFYADELSKLQRWQKQNINLVASQSDVGIHNMLQRGVELYFFDFEYAGKDDISKLVCDYTIQPEYQWNEWQKRRLISNLRQLGGCNLFGIGWEERIKDLEPLITTKWITILMKRGYNQGLGQKMEDRIRRYVAMTKRMYRKRGVKVCLGRLTKME